MAQHAPGVPFILVGTKFDLRDDVETKQRLEAKRMAPITEAQGQELCAELGGKCYIECSALTQHKLKHVFDQGIRVVLDGQKDKKQWYTTFTRD